MISILFSGASQAQIDPQFTQYMFNETFINPAYVGSQESISATLLYRNQWVGIEGAPKTQTFSIHAPVKNRHVGLGISVMNEEIGISHQLSVYGYFAYRILYPHSALSFGLGGGFSNREERLSEVRTIVPGDQQFMTDLTKNFLPNSSFGIYYYNKKFYAGLSIPRLMENKIIISSVNSVVENTVNYKLWHYNLATGYVFTLNEDLKFKPSLLIKVVQNAPVEFDLNANFIIRDFLWLGAGYRTGDAVSALFGLQLSRQLLFGYSYDYTLTPLQTYNSGTHEISLRFNFGYNKKLVISTRYF
jgi:type IX secretion system PorP/SprF family membrane protein